VPSRDEPHARRAAPSTSLHRSGPRSCTSRQTVHAADPWRCGEDTPEMERTPGQGPGSASCGDSAPVQCPATPRGKLLMNIPGSNRMPCGAITARAGHGDAWHCEGCERHAAQVEKQKGPEPCGVRASVKRAWEVRAYALPPPGST